MRPPVLKACLPMCLCVLNSLVSTVRQSLLSLFNDLLFTHPVSQSLLKRSEESNSTKARHFESIGVFLTHFTLDYGDFSTKSIFREKRVK